MYKIKLFSAQSMHELQDAINEWLQANKEILIHQSNLTANSVEEKRLHEYAFFILYAVTGAEAAQLKEIAATVTQEQSVEVKEINPEILKPTS